MRSVSTPYVCHFYLESISYLLWYCGINRYWHRSYVVLMFLNYTCWVWFKYADILNIRYLPVTAVRVLSNCLPEISYAAVVICNNSLNKRVLRNSHLADFNKFVGLVIYEIYKFLFIHYLRIKTLKMHIYYYIHTSFNFLQIKQSLIRLSIDNRT